MMSSDIISSKDKMKKNIFIETKLKKIIGKKYMTKKMTFLNTNKYLGFKYNINLIKINIKKNRCLHIL